MPLSTAGIAENNGKVLVAQRKMGGALGGKWEFPGGKVEYHETPQDGLVREFREEFNVGIEVGSLIYEGRFSNKNVHYELKAYKVKLLDGVIELREHQRADWLYPEDILKLDLADSDRPIAELIRRTGL